MSTDARLQEHHVSKALLPGPRRTPKLPALPIPHAPTRSCGDATLSSHAPNGDRTRHPGGRLNGLDSLSRDHAKARKLTEPVGRGPGLCPAAPPLGGGAHPCLAEPQPPTGEGCRENNRERGDLALYCQRQADVAPPGSRLPVDVRPLLSAISVSLCSDGDSKSNSIVRL